MCGSMVYIQFATAEIGKDKKARRRKKLEMWANAQRDGRPAEQRCCSYCPHLVPFPSYYHFFICENKKARVTLTMPFFLWW